MTILNMIRNIDLLGRWHKAHQVAQQIHDVEKDYIGWEVLEVTQDTRGNDINSKAIIVKITWEDSIWNASTGRSGSWSVGIRYLATGKECWTSFDALIDTGTVYVDIDAIRPVYSSKFYKSGVTE